MHPRLALVARVRSSSCGCGVGAFRREPWVVCSRSRSARRCRSTLAGCSRPVLVRRCCGGATAGFLPSGYGRCAHAATHWRLLRSAPMALLAPC